MTPSLLRRMLSAALAATVAAACALGSTADPGEAGGAADPGARDAAAGPAPARDDAGSDGAVASPDAAVCPKRDPGDVCGLVAQCGCASDETCDAVAGKVACVKAGPKPAAAPCTSTSECARGLSCRGGACRPFCDGASACSAPGLGACASPVEGLGGVTACTVTCELQAPAKTCGTSTCAFVAGTTDCRPAGAKAIGASCTNDAECVAGATCAPTIYGPLCLRWCRIGKGECPGFGICTSPFSSSITIDGVELGVCPS